ncbi:MmpS family transport accessory protein [Cystobacter fuscus]
METATSLIPTFVPAPMGYAVKYEVIGSGEGTITKITYRDGSSTPVVVENPTLPWTRTVTLFPGANVGIGMEGSVTNGRFEVMYNGTLNSTSGGSNSAQVSGSEACEQRSSSSTRVN